MEIRNLPFRIIDWDTVTTERVAGETGSSLVKAVATDLFQSRIVTYEAGYCADHWCDKGHILLMLEGELILEFKNGDSATFAAGQGFQVGDGEEPHRVRTETTATAFIVD